MSVILVHPSIRASNLIQFRGLPLAYAQWDGNQVVAVLQAGATQQQQDEANLICTQTGNTMWQTKLIDKMRDDIVTGTTAAQRTTIWNDLKTLVNGRAKIVSTKGVNEAGIKALQFLIDNVAGLTVAEKNEARVLAAAMYCQDNPYYLSKPPFLPSIDIPGDEPAPGIPVS